MKEDHWGLWGKSKKNRNVTIFQKPNYKNLQEKKYIFKRMKIKLVCISEVTVEDKI